MGLITLNSTHKLIKGEIEKFAAAELEPIAADIEKDGSIPRPVMQKISEMGLLGLTVPEAYGGSGLDLMSLCIALEELAKSSASLAIIVSVNNCLITYPLMKFGTDDIKEVYLRKISSGSIGGYAPYSEVELSGNECGSESEGDNRYVSDRYEVVLNGANADFFILPVKSETGVSLFVINKGAPGLNFRTVRTMGLRSAGITGVEFRRNDLTGDKRLVEAKGGYQAIQTTLEYAHIGFSAVALGLAQASLNASIRYAKERKQFGRAIAEFPMVQAMLAEMRIIIEKSRLLVYEAAQRYDNGEEYRMISRIACLTSCEGAVKTGLHAIQIHGGYGYTRDYPVERYFRDAKSLQLLGEAPVDLKEKIAKEILL